MNELMNHVGEAIVPMLNSRNGLPYFAIFSIAAIVLGDMYKEVLYQGRIDTKQLQTFKSQEIDERKEDS